MAFRGGNNNRNRNFGNNYGGGPMGNNRMGGGMNMSPWDNQNPGGNYGGGNMRSGGGGGGVGGQGMNAQAISLANNLLNNLFRNQNPPSLLDLPRGGGMSGNRNQRGGPMVNRSGLGGNRLNRRVQGGGFNNRGGQKSGSQKQSGGIRKQNSFDRTKKVLAKNSNKKKDSASADKSDNFKKNESGPKESPYANVPNDMFYCHLCKKHMWDANSFENHIKGRTHLMMREGIEESYRLKANMIRQEAKIAEQLKSIELDRLKRMGKSKSRQLEYCTMCDLNFHGHLSAHRKSDGHLQLKKFLHPKCVECNKEFSTRIDFDSHLLSADHLKKAAEKNTKVGERKRNTLTILTEEDESKDVRPPQKKKKKPATAVEGEIKKEGGEEGTEIKKEPEDGADDVKKELEDGAADEAKEEDLIETMEEEEVALPEDPEDCILDYSEGDEIPVEVDVRLPKYNWTRPVGASLVTKLECYECSLCGKFFDTEKTVEIHSRTVSHHRQFLKFINEKSSDTKIAQKRAAAAYEESERKRRKIEEAEAKTTDSTMDSVTAESVEIKTENGEGGEEVNDELYDPSEATGDDEDAEMAGENGDAAEEEDEENIAEEEEEVAAENGDEEMEAEEEELPAIEEKEEEPVTPVVAKQEPAKEPTPVVTTAVAPKPALASPVVQSIPQKKMQVAATPSTPAPTPTTPSTPGPRSATKGAPRGRPRGRYNRY